MKRASEISTGKGPAGKMSMGRVSMAGGAIVLLLASAVGIDDVVWRGAHAAAVFAALSDPASILAGRSPGERSGPLLQTKGMVHAASVRHDTPEAGDGPEERVLALVRDHPDEYGPAGGVDGFSPDGPRLPGIGEGPPGGGFYGGPPPSGGLMGPGLEGVSGGPPSYSSPPPNTPVLSPAPEPATWMTMIMALFGAGAALRLKRARQGVEGTGTGRANA